MSGPSKRRGGTVTTTSTSSASRTTTNATTVATTTSSTTSSTEATGSGGAGSSSGSGGPLPVDQSAGPVVSPSLGWNVEGDPIDPSYLTSLTWGERSFWDQPWRAYMNTVPTSTLLNATGINFNVTPEEAPATAAALAAAGFKRARVEINWNQLSYSDPGQFVNPSYWDTILTALKDNGIRPLILLNANDSAPTPMLSWTADVTQAAPAGATTVQLSPASAAQVVPGYSGLNNPNTSTAAQWMITSVSASGLATLSQPLPVALPAGSYAASTLRYLPFAEPFEANGTTPNPAFQATEQGWLAYVKTVTQGVASVLGDDDFDVEIWNELTFGSDFLSASNYYSPVPASMQGTGSVDDQLLDDTVTWLRNPANGVSGVGIGDGFANQTPFADPSQLPAGLTAIDKHPYKNATQFGPSQGPLSNEPLNALGQPEGTRDGSDWLDSFAPDLDAVFPEYYLTAIQTETLERDLAPITTDIGGVPHGEDSASTGARQMWITEYGIDPTYPAGLSQAADWNLQTKAILRFLAAYVNKGADNVDFYAAKGIPYGLIPGSFYSSVDAGGDPGLAGAGGTLQAMGHFLSSFGTPAAITDPRSLSLTAVADQHNYTIWSGDGTAGHPSLLGRDMLAVLPFQTTNTSFAVPVYVMTEDLDTDYDPSAPSSDVSQYDLPNETYRISLSGLDPSGLSITDYDPITNEDVPVQWTATGPDSVDVTLSATDYPRVLQINDGATS